MYDQFFKGKYYYVKLNNKKITNTINNSYTLFINTHFQSCIKNVKRLINTIPIEISYHFHLSSPTLTLFRNIRIQRSGIEFTRELVKRHVLEPTTFYVASRTKKERDIENETREERRTLAKRWNEKDRKNRM